MNSTRDRRVVRRGILALAWGIGGCIQYVSPPTQPLPAERLAAAEALYRDARDLWFRAYVVRESARGRSANGPTLDELERSHAALRERALERLQALEPGDFGAEDRHAIEVMRATLEAGEDAAATPLPTTLSCARAIEPTSDRPELVARLRACYTRAAARVITLTDTVDRLTVLGRLASDSSSARRRALWLSLQPVWASVNGDNTASSPWRRLVALDAPRWRAERSPVDDAARSLGLEPSQVEPTLLALLEAWRAATPDSLVEPWDWWYENGAASRRLSPRLPLASLEQLNESWYSSIGASPRALGVQYDLAPRDGKSAVAFTQFGGVPRRTRDGPRGAAPQVIATYRTGGFGNLAELFHETGHAIHIAAIDTRPAFADWPASDPFTEGLADVPAHEVYEGTWQAAQLGDSASRRDNLREKYGGVMMDVAWALFELRMYRDPARDPNAVWSELTSRYLHIRPHPEWSWWAMRGQLIDAPGYMMNYALGAMVAADVRAQLRQRHGGFGRRDLYRVLARELYRFGRERPAREVLRDFLGHTIGPATIVAELRALR